MRSCHTFGKRSNLLAAACDANDTNKRAAAASTADCAPRLKRNPPWWRRKMLRHAPLAAAVPVGREHQLVRIAGLECRVSGVRHYRQVRLGPRAMQIPGAGGGADDVVTSLNDGRRNVPDARHIVQQLTFAAQEAAIHEV